MNHDAMNSISCECKQHEGQPVACCGDFVCPNETAESSDSQKIDDRIACPDSETATLEGKSRVNAIRRIFEGNTVGTGAHLENITTNSQPESPAILLQHKNDDNERIALKGDTANKSTTPVDTQLFEHEAARFYRSHTQIVNIPNGIKIITMILVDDNLGPEEPCAYETMICPESEIIRQFERDFRRIDRKS
ncbi:uncharacterized protein LOC131681329 [Topomyia yanbarensis]|uniref:uncharacterized protein LOC131681329 n=1 Tax=Topomyia yanbarensis TaxID=2498891 RepID=UPI00273B8D99|nr:uncharacterized protein LOC131681329 [Topomyia yanbarensis]